MNCGEILCLSLWVPKHFWIHFKTSKGWYYMRCSCCQLHLLQHNSAPKACPAQLYFQSITSISGLTLSYTLRHYCSPYPCFYSFLLNKELWRMWKLHIVFGFTSLLNKSIISQRILDRPPPSPLEQLGYDCTVYFVRMYLQQLINH